jgi:ADP-heptose:LPS heptosyltransferase
VKKIILSPYSLNWKNKENPKNYPYWQEVVQELKVLGFYVIRLGVKNESKILGVDEEHYDLPLREIKNLIKNNALGLSGDNFFHHLCWANGVKCVVVFSLSDPERYGHKENVNLLKDRSFINYDTQFKLWRDVEFNKDAFIDYKIVVDCVKREGGDG